MRSAKWEDGFGSLVRGWAQMKVCEDDAGGAFIRATAWRSQVDEDDFWGAFIRAIYVSHVCAAHGDFPLLFFQRDVCVFDWVGRSEIARCQITVLTFAGAFESSDRPAKPRSRVCFGKCATN